MKSLLILLCSALAGCAGFRPVTTVKVAVPIKCQTPVPVRPVMPTEVLEDADLAKLKPADKAFVITRAALAEISFREGYEGELVAALKSCL